MTATIVLQNLRSLAKKGFGTPILVIIMISMLVVPLAPFLLDLMFTFNIVFALVLLLGCVYCCRPLDFAVFPTVLLIATLLRLVLNIASTRVILLEGHTGIGAAGQVIESFGSVVVGSNYVVGLVIFAILVVINFVVVTKGAGRVSEVSARFTLDALPGKQLAIDAELNAGLINQKEAKQRREEVVQETDFYGAMDGASKFIRGDAVAGILILFINIIGGLSVGIMQHDMSFSDAVHNYTLLTIGDGLVAQIPSLLLSTAAGIIVTRASRAQDMSYEIVRQVFGNSRALFIAAVVIASLGIIPGMPHIAFLFSAAVISGLAYWLLKQQRVTEGGAKQPDAKLNIVDTTNKAEKKSEDRELCWDDVSPVAIFGLEIGYGLISLVDGKKNGQLLQRIKELRKKLSQELGFLLPSVHICDNLDLSPKAYRITVAGVVAGESKDFLDQYLTVHSKQEPVDISTMIVIHMEQVLKLHVAQLFGYEEAQQLFDRLAKAAPKLVSELLSTQLPLSTVVVVLRNLLADNIPIRDIRTIAENLVMVASESKDPEILTDAVRVSLKRHPAGNNVIPNHSSSSRTTVRHPAAVTDTSSRGLTAGPRLE